MITTKQAMDVLIAEQKRNKQLASAAQPGQPEHANALRRVEAYGLALVTLGFMVPKAPIYDPKINSYRCSTCGCLVGFQVRPGVRCYSCPSCMHRVDWFGIDFD